MTKKPVQFRLSDNTLARLDWLQQRLDLNRSQVVRLAVAEMYKRHRQTQLVEVDDGRWALMMGEVAIAQIEEEELDALIETDPNLVGWLRAGVPDEIALARLLLSVLKVGAGRS